MCPASVTNMKMCDFLWRCYTITSPPDTCYLLPMTLGLGTGWESGHSFPEQCIQVLRDKRITLTIDLNIVGGSFYLAVTAAAQQLYHRFNFANRSWTRTEKLTYLHLNIKSGWTFLLRVLVWEEGVVSLSLFPSVSKSWQAASETLSGRRQTRGDTWHGHDTCHRGTRVTWLDLVLCHSAIRKL